MAWPLVIGMSAARDAPGGPGGPRAGDADVSNLKGLAPFKVPSKRTSQSVFSSLAA